MSIVNSIHLEWLSLAKPCTSISLSAPILSTPTVRTHSGNVPIADVSPKQSYQLFLERKQILPTAKQKLQDKYSDVIVDWERVYSLAFNVTLESKLREFQYKILNCIVYTNGKLFRLGLTTLHVVPFARLRRHRINWAFTLFLPSIYGVLAKACDLVKG